MYWYILMVMFIYVHMCMDVNTTMSYVIKLQQYGYYVIMILLSCYYAIMWLCYHDVMMLCGLAISRMIIVNTMMNYVIRLHYVVCCHIAIMFFFKQSFHCKYYKELCSKAP